MASYHSAAEIPPTIPVGFDAYRQWEKWPQQRLGVRAYMRSTYDRSGGNEGADASHFLFQLSDTNNVTLDITGLGILYFARYNHWHGSPWHYVPDGLDRIVQESSTATPDSPIANSVFLPTNSFRSPLALTWSTTKGADLSWVPVSFTNSFRMDYGRTHYGTGYYIYDLYDRAAPLSQEITTWDAQAPPPQDVLDLIARAGSDIAPTNNLATMTGSLPSLAQSQTNLLIVLSNAPATIRKLTFTVPLNQALAFGHSRLRITWDGRAQPSIDAPTALFFGAGSLYNRNNNEYLVKAFPEFIHFTPTNVELACFFPMPFFKSALVELIGATNSSVTNIAWAVGSQPFTESPNTIGYFHATYHDHLNPPPGQDLVLLDTRQTEGGGDWAGNFVGTSFIFSEQANLGTLEGDPRFFFDDSQTPQAYGTGTEEWGGGGDYWGGQTMSLAFAGHPVGAPSAAAAQNDEDKIESAYRFLLADLMPFGKNAVIKLEHGGTDDSMDHYQTVTYWYGAPAATLVQTDTVKIGDAASEAAHNYVSPQASASYSITSRYELGVDTFTYPIASMPMATPANYAEFRFQAESNKTYYIWVRGENLDGTVSSDATWLQFDEEIGTINLGKTYNNTFGFGNWKDTFPALTYAWSSARPQDPPQTITFNRSGIHTIRVQPRQWKHYLEQIWLSATQTNLPAASATPAATANDVVMHATNAINLHGLVKLVNDASSAIGKVLEIDSTSATDSMVPTSTDFGRTTTGTSEFTVQLNPANFGALLRRKLDYSFPNQRALIYVADASPGSTATNEWALAGTWYLAGANTCVYSNPGSELGSTAHTVQTSNRHFRDDEFLLPRDLTRGRSAVRIRVQFMPSNIPLFPGRALDPQAWSEMRYDVYSYVMPNWAEAPRITATVITNGNALIQWTGGGALQSSPSLSPSAIWSNVAVGGTFIDPVNGNKFYRVAR